MSSSSSDSSNGKGRKGRHSPPATNFDKLLSKIDSASSKPKKARSFLKRIGTLTRQITIGPTVTEKDKVEHAISTFADNAMTKLVKLTSGSQNTNKETPEEREARLRGLREKVLAQGRNPRKDDLYDLAAYEGVYLNRRPSSRQRSNKGYSKLAAWLVARVAGPIAEGKYMGQYFFLGRSKTMYVGSDPIGLDSIKLPLDDEWEFRDIREIARAYYCLCD